MSHEDINFNRKALARTAKSPSCGLTRAGFLGGGLPFGTPETGFLDYLARTVGHAKTRAEMFGKEHHGIPVLRRILLRKILHGFNQHPLPFNIAGIGSFFPAAATTGWIGQYGNGKNLGHDKVDPIIQTRGDGDTL